MVGMEYDQGRAYPSQTGLHCVLAVSRIIVDWRYFCYIICILGSLDMGGKWYTGAVPLAGYLGEMVDATMPTKDASDI